MGAPIRSAQVPAEVVTLPTEGYILQHAYCLLLGGISNQTIWRMRKSGRISPPFKLTAKLNAWPVETVRGDLKRIAEAASGPHRA